MKTKLTISVLGKVGHISCTLLNYPHDVQKGDFLDLPRELVPADRKLEVEKRVWKQVGTTLTLFCYVDADLYDFMSGKGIKDDEMPNSFTLPDQSWG